MTNLINYRREFTLELQDIETMDQLNTWAGRVDASRAAGHISESDYMELTLSAEPQYLELRYQQEKAEEVCGPECDGCERCEAISPDPDPIIKIDINVARSPRYDQNIETYGDHSDTCFICGKRTNNDGAMIHYLTSGHITPNDEEGHPDCQGWFPIGPDCNKRIQKLFKSKSI